MPCYHHSGHDRADHDFYATPPSATELLTENVRLRGGVWEPCGGKGDMAAVLAAAGYKVLASDKEHHEGCVFPVVSNIDALTAPLPPGVRSIVTNPPYARGILPKLIRHWLPLLQPVGGQLCLLLRAFWGESKGGQLLTTQHIAYAGKIKTPRRVRWLEGTSRDKKKNPKDEHAWFLWDWRRDPTRLPFDASPGDSRLRGCEVCGAPTDNKRRHAVVCSTSCRVTRHRRRARGMSGSMSGFRIR